MIQERTCYIRVGCEELVRISNTLKDKMHIDVIFLKGVVLWKLFGFFHYLYLLFNFEQFRGYFLELFDCFEWYILFLHLFHHIVELLAEFGVRLSIILVILDLLKLPFHIYKVFFLKFGGILMANNKLDLALQLATIFRLYSIFKIMDGLRLEQ